MQYFSTVFIPAISKTSVVLLTASAGLQDWMGDETTATYSQLQVSLHGAEQSIKRLLLSH